MAEVKPSLLAPDFLPFQHPKLVDEPPRGPAWVHEIKYDGYRMQLHVRGGRATLWTRNGNDWTDRFPELAATAGKLRDCVLDGELCAIGSDGKPSFSMLRSAIARGATEDLVLFAFDVLWDEVDDMRTEPMVGRKVRLRKVLNAAPAVAGRIVYVEHFEADGRALLRQACGTGLEGIVSKLKGAPYKEGRRDAWQKAKCRPGQEVVIGGWRTDGARFTGLLAGVYEGPELHYVGSIKTGFPAEAAISVMQRLKSLEERRSPFVGEQPPRNGAGLHWCRPEMVANVDFAEWTASGKLRQSSFKGLRDDKDPREVVREG